MSINEKTIMEYLEELTRNFGIEIRYEAKRLAGRTHLEVKVLYGL
ncbi:MAG TPA: hypothetical protein VLK23_09190 [Thermodesulfobacteriota bacterium]|nr:hypothetical protein [Thermodesulfobacteriota bacterium]